MFINVFRCYQSNPPGFKLFYQPGNMFQMIINSGIKVPNRKVTEKLTPTDNRNSLNSSGGNCIGQVLRRTLLLGKVPVIIEHNAGSTFGSQFLFNQRSKHVSVHNVAILPHGMIDINTNPGKVTTFGGNKCPMPLRTGQIPLKNQFVNRKFHGIGIRIPICCHFSQRWKAISGRKLIRFKLFAQITRQLDMKPYIPRRNKIAKFFGRYLFHEYLLYFCTCEINYTTFYKKKQYQY